MCEKCLGDPQGCSHCGSPALIPCPDCEDGNRYFIIDPDSGEYIDCSKDEYMNAPEEYRGYETCDTCGGNYWIDDRD